MDIQIDPGRPTYSNRRRSSGVGRALVQLGMFAASLIPMCIIAWKLDVAGLLRGRTPAPVVVAQPIPPESIVAEPPRIELLQRRRNRFPKEMFQPAESEIQEPESQIVEAANHEPDFGPLPAALRPVGQPRDDDPQVAPSTSETVRLLLDEDYLREEIAIDGPLRVTRIGHYSFEADNFSGDLPCVARVSGGPRDILLDLSVDDGAIEIKPIVMTDDGHEADFTIDNLKIICGRIARTGRITENRIAKIEAKRESIQNWLAAPGKKALAAVKVANARVTALGKEIGAANDRLAAITREFRAAVELLEYAREFHGTQLTFEQFAEPVGE